MAFELFPKDPPVMSDHEGQNLLVYILENTSKLSARNWIIIFIHCVREVNELHCGHKSHSGKKYLHRDIKFGHFVINDQGIIRLNNYNFVIEMPKNGDLFTDEVGTANSMAPEIHSHKAFSEKSDIYALGIMLSEILSGSLPELQKNLGLCQLQQLMVAPDPKDRPSLASVKNYLEWIYLESMSDDKAKEKVHNMLNGLSDITMIDEQNPLLWAAAFGLETELEKWLQKGADVNQQDNNGVTPLMAAVRKNRAGTVRFLLNTPGVDFSIQDKQGATAADYAHKYQSPESLIEIEKRKKQILIELALQSEEPVEEIKKYDLLNGAIHYQLIPECIQCSLQLSRAIGNDAIIPEYFAAINNAIHDKEQLLLELLQAHQPVWARQVLSAGLDPQKINTEGMPVIDFALDCEDIELAMSLLYLGVVLTPLSEWRLLDEEPRVLKCLKDFVNEAQFPEEVSRLIVLVEQFRSLYDRKNSLPVLVGTVGFFAPDKIQRNSLAILSELNSELRTKLPQNLVNPINTSEDEATQTQIANLGLRG